MPPSAVHPTPYPDVNAVLHELLSNAQAILGGHFVGMYLYGSLASGDFDPDTSDIDFAVATAAEVPDELIPVLDEMHLRLASSGQKWASKLEGSYVSQHVLRRYEPNQPPCPQINEGRFYLAPHGSDWVIQRHIIREHGVVLAGPAPETLIDPVQPDDLRRAVKGTLTEWWAPMLNDPARLQDSVYQAYAVLTMCRALYTLEHGTIASKPRSARWAQEALDERWRELIEQAVAWRPGRRLDKFTETLEFIRYAKDRG